MDSRVTSDLTSRKSLLTKAQPESKSSICTDNLNAQPKS